MWMLLGVVCGQSHFVPLWLWSIDVYHLVLFLSADSSTGFGSQLEEIVTQGAMLESQYETPTCNLLVHYLHPFLFSTRKGETCHDSNGIFMGSCMHMWSYHPTRVWACLGHYQYFSSAKFWCAAAKSDGVTSMELCVCALIHTPCNIIESHSCCACFILFSSLIWLLISNAYSKRWCLTRSECMTWGRAKVVAGKRPLEPQRS